MRSIRHQERGIRSNCGLSRPICNAFIANRREPSSVTNVHIQKQHRLLLCFTIMCGHARLTAMAIAKHPKTGELQCQ
ncbi:hypothetical protein BA177_15870 [Woeseia oceani]|uniref:Uncharacterized protein n=1 Tax=Woeseia oceani TaxID=1548547 RepID=A0A193LJ91_9GAMM|nr:hypothetical protein BA177_15870 [Woeseia oceani]